VAALILFNLDRRGFSAQVYQQVFASRGFYERFPAKLAETLMTATSESSGIPLVIQGLSVRNWEVFVRALLPADTLKEMGDQALDSLIDFLEMRTDTAVVSLTPLKASLVSDTGVRAVFILLATQPDCTLAQVADLTLAILTKGQLQFCNPPAQMTGLLKPLVGLALQATSSSIPDQWIVASQAGSPAQDDPRQRLQRYRLLMRLSPLLPLAFLLAITALAVRSLHSWLRWWGYPFLVSGLSAVLIGIAGAPLFRSFSQFIVVRYAPAYLPEILLDYAGELAAAMVRELLIPVVWQATVLASIGAAMLLVSLLTRPRTQA